VAEITSASLQKFQSAQQPLQLILLTHATEFSKLSNTGTLVAPALATEPALVVQRLAWSRVAPDAQLLQMAEAGQLMLLYPTPEAMVLNADTDPVPDNNVTTITTNSPAAGSLFCQNNNVIALQNIRGFVLLDATWQLAHKMYRQSPYLQALPTLSLQSSQPSQYLLRRNQRQQGWCTAESVALLLAATGYNTAAQKVSKAFFLFNQRN
jgi:DTW domain-containing protein YfiP